MRAKVLLLQVIVFAAFLAWWQVVASSSDRLRFLFGSPFLVAGELWRLVTEGDFFRHLGVTLGEAGLGLILGTLCGSAAGLLLWYSATVARVSRPFVIAAGAIPILTLAPMMIVWFGIGFWMKVAMSFLSTFFVSLAAASRGASLVSSTYVELLVAIRASRTQIFRKVIVPGSIDWVLASTKLNAGFSLLGAIVGEFIASHEGIGFLVQRSASLYNVPRALAASTGIVLLAFLFHVGAEYLDRSRYRLAGLMSVPPILRRGSHSRRRSMTRSTHSTGTAG